MVPAGRTARCARLAIALLAVTLVSTACSKSESGASFQASDVTGVNWGRDFRLLDPAGVPRTLADYRGKVVMLVNVASKCGLTPQYAGLEKLYEQYKDRDFVIIGFPANNFGGQEPGTNEEIKQFCTLKYKVSFPMFAKISVKGADIHPLYKFLTSKETDPEFGGDITWNFNKFLVDRNGKIIARFQTGEKPEGEKVTQAIEKALK